LQCFIAFKLKESFVIFTVVVYIHLIATCAAIGTIVITDLRLIAKVLGYRVVIPKPERFETVMISAALFVLYLTGGALVWLGLESNPGYLNNPKLQGKLVLVAFLTVNAFFLHFWIFPILGRSKPVSQWRYMQWTSVAAGVSLSNSIWFFCAFLGVARVWNNTVSLQFVLSIAAVVWAGTFLLVNVVLLLASRNKPKKQADWIDSLKASLSDLTTLSAQTSVKPSPTQPNRADAPRRSH
jgi:hypothetical protein